MSIPFAFHIPFVELIGCTLERFEAGEAELALVLDEAKHTNSFGVAHGGLQMTLLDVAMAHAARSLRQSEGGGPGLVTLELKTSFMRPGTGTLRVEGKVLSASASLAFTEGKVFDGQGKLCAHATATFKYLRALPVDGRDVRPAPKLAGPGSD